MTLVKTVISDILFGGENNSLHDYWVTERLTDKWDRTVLSEFIVKYWSYMIVAIIV